jgi:hypothetical protein
MKNKNLYATLDAKLLDLADFRSQQAAHYRFASLAQGLGVLSKILQIDETTQTNLH